MNALRRKQWRRKRPAKRRWNNKTQSRLLSATNEGQADQSWVLKARSAVGYVLLKKVVFVVAILLTCLQSVRRFQDVAIAASVLRLRNGGEDQTVLARFATLVGSVSDSYGSRIEDILTLG